MPPVFTIFVTWFRERGTQPCAAGADKTGMSTINSLSVNAAVSNASNSTPGTVGNAASLLVLRKAMDAQEAGAAALLAALPQQPALATEGHLGRNLNTYA